MDQQTLLQREEAQDNSKVRARRLGGHISHWDPEDLVAWEAGNNVYGFSAGDKFLFGTTATMVGACLRLPYSLATAIFGGRNWVIFSSIVLLIAIIGTMVLLMRPGLPLWPYLVCAALTGLGGGNFAASMSNANAFYPHRLKGLSRRQFRTRSARRGWHQPGAA